MYVWWAPSGARGNIWLVPSTKAKLFIEAHGSTPGLRDKHFLVWTSARAKNKKRTEVGPTLMQYILSRTSLVPSLLVPVHSTSGAPWVPFSLHTGVTN